MPQENEKAGEPRQPRANGPEKPRPEDLSAADTKQGMARMMAQCGCGPDMRAKMAGAMGSCGPAAVAGSDPAQP